MALRVLRAFVRGLAMPRRRFSSIEAVGVRVDDDRVQELLLRMTGMDLDRVFATRKEPLMTPHFRLMSEAQLKRAHTETVSEARELLKMPPVAEEREERGEVIAKDERLSGYLDNKIVFTDTSEHKENKSRRIVVRDCDGSLREATWEERDRMCQVFFPALGRRMWLPPMLSTEHLPSALRQDLHLDALELACTQCEPDSSDYIRVHLTVYKDIERRSRYDCLRSTRHFAGLVWHLVGRRKEAGLLTDMLDRRLYSDAEDLVELCVMCHAHSLPAAEQLAELSGRELVEAYCDQLGLTDAAEMLRAAGDRDDSTVAEQTH